MRGCHFGSAVKNRKHPSTHRFLPTKLQVADAQNKGLFDRSRFFTAPPIGRSFSTLDVPTFPKKVLKTPKGVPARVDSVKYACLTMNRVDFRGGVRHGGAGCWQHRIC